MGILIRRMTVFLSLAVGLCTTVTAGADYGNCSVPTAIDPPLKLGTDREANEWLEKMDSYSVDVGSYLLCLATYAEDNKAVISSSELDSIRKSHAATIHQARRVADIWNKSYASYQKRYAEAGK